MPDLVRLLAHPHARLGLVRLGIVEAQLDALGVLGEEREVHALPVPGRAKRIRTAWPNARVTIYHAILRTTSGGDGSEDEVTSITPCGDT